MSVILNFIQRVCRLYRCLIVSVHLTQLTVFVWCVNVKSSTLFIQTING